MWKKAEKKLSKDKYMGPLIEKYGHCTISLGKKKDYFFDLVESIVGQQLSGKAAESILKRIKSELGDIVPLKIIGIPDKKLRECGLSWSKIKYLKELSHNVNRGDLDIEEIRHKSNEKIIEELTRVKGIGPWTAKMFLMFSLGRPDIFPVEDLGIRNGIRKILGKNLEPEKIEIFAARWKPYRTIASWYIWKALENN